MPINSDEKIQLFFAGLRFVRATSPSASVWRAPRLADAAILRCATGRLAAVGAAGQMPLAGSKVCDNCGTQEASCWYGKAGGPHWCKKAACMRAGGYLPPLQARRGKRARSGGEGSDGAGPNDEDMLAVEPIPPVWELLAVEGQRFCGRVAKVCARRGPCTR